MTTDELPARLSQLPTTPPVTTASAVLTLARQRRRRRRIGLATAGTLAAGALVVALIGGGSDTAQLRARGVPVATATTVRVHGVAEGRRGVRPVTDGTLLAADEALVVRITTGGPGALQVTADGGLLWPASGQTWSVRAGEHFLGDAEPLAWTPDGDRSGAHTVVATLCPHAASTAGCVEHALTVRWEAP
ncbi:MAG: hypothetical protein KTR31_04250 [Myxococcales bacterium]|nr:hypothetical protein [Myxococcales bacterium]